ncbi:hypothetical protein HELRODRAFT_183921 [Helobdella robusta]|uniref:Uncharacterized protein n=1 Tax=Helobdella robusta TaxID=6412 RepID=T1FKA8_HELRO|nr:hypothetical protein HELRODRAFT_183921 [Helobdella robusta]ESO09739.1 hypothetical protein HELRODRAFT_183921 [Helobdella robusta]
MGFRKKGEETPPGQRINPIFNFSNDIQIILPSKSTVVQEPISTFKRDSCQNILYRTSNSEYGSMPPSEIHIPEVFRTKDNSFTKGRPSERRCTLHSMNTELDSKELKINSVSISDG